MLVIRASGASRLDVAASGGIAEASRRECRAAPPAGTEERRYTITDRGHRDRARRRATTTSPGRSRPSPIARRRSRSPRSRSRRLRGSLQLSYKIEDDYGVTERAGDLRAARTATAQTARSRARSTVPPDFPLVLPQARTRNGVGQTTKDLSEHPWAGADVVHDADRRATRRQRRPQRADRDAAARARRSPSRSRAR